MPASSGLHTSPGFVVDATSSTPTTTATYPTSSTSHGGGAHSSAGDGGDVVVAARSSGSETAAWLAQHQQHQQQQQQQPSHPPRSSHDAAHRDSSSFNPYYSQQHQQHEQGQGQGQQGASPTAPLHLPVHPDPLAEAASLLRASASATPRLSPLLLSRTSPAAVRLARSAARRLRQRCLIDTGGVATSALAFHPWADILISVDVGDGLSLWNIESGAAVGGFSVSEGGRGGCGCLAMAGGRVG